jgi:hypothetical protein
MDHNRRDDIPQVLDEENDILISPYSEDEIKKVVFHKEHQGPLMVPPGEFY